MLQQHRARIDTCRDCFIRRVNITRLWPKLLEHKIFNCDDVNIPRWKDNLGDIKTIDEMLITIKTRGPHAFNNLLKCLREIDQADLAATLQGANVETTVNNNANNSTDVTGNLPQNQPPRVQSNNLHNIAVENLEDDFNDLNIFDDKPVIIKVRKSTEFLDKDLTSVISRYPMQSNPRGLVLLITIQNYPQYARNNRRAAAEYDHENLKELFEGMGFTVISKWDLKASEIKTEVEHFSQRPELRRVDSCFVIISGHGDRSATEETVILGTDDVGARHPDHQVSCLQIVQYFSAEACPNLRRKPKIFIFQTCRGKDAQYMVMDRGGSGAKYNEGIHITNDEVPRDCGLRNFSDVLIAQSTLQGYVSYRDNICGSWFIQILCKVFMTMACAYHIRDLFDKIDELIATKRTDKNQCQTTTVKSIGFHKHLYINPGLFPDES